MNKKFLIIFISTIAIVLLGTITANKAFAVESVDEVTELAFEKFSTQSIQVVEDESKIWIDVYDMKDAKKVENFFNENLSDEDLEKYDIEIFSRKGIDYE